MKLFRNDVDSFNNLVFEKRNRDYGAYAIRESYNGNATKSILITAGTFLLLVILLSSFSGSKITTEEKLFKVDDSTTILSIKPIDIPEPKVEEQKPQPASAASKAASFVKFTNTADTTNSMKPNDNIADVTGKSNNPLANGISPFDTGSVVVPTNTVVVYNPPVEPAKPRLWAETMPKYNGDMVDFIQRNVVFPESALASGANGTVYISFVIDEKGAVSNVKAVKGIGYGCDEEAERVVRKMTKWIPGKMGSENVKVMMNLPIKFKSYQ